MTSKTVFIIVASILIAAPNVYNIWSLLKSRPKQVEQETLQPLLGVVLPKDKKEK
jgi:hypothetical protein